MINLIGDSSSGKTLFALSCLAEAANSKAFQNYRLIFDDVENANTFNMHYMFGEKLAQAIEPPAWQDTDEGPAPQPSDTIEDFHCNILDALEEDRPFIYVLDSFDALDSDRDKDKVEEMRSARIRGVKAKGSYEMAKPKKSSALLRNICGKLKQTQSILIIISQTRDNINPLSFEKKSRSGGKALKFYAHHEIWLAIGKKIKSKDIIIGTNVIAKIDKNKLTGKKRQVQFPIYYDLGVDDVKSCVDYLVAEKVWKKNKQTVNAKHINLKASIPKIIHHVESKNLEDKIRKVVNRTWNKKESEIRLKRKRRYL